MIYLLKDKQYFLEFLKTEEERIQKFSRLLNDCATDNQKTKCNLFLMGFYKNVVYCKCSLNEFDDGFKSAVKKYLSLNEKLENIISEAEKIDSIAIKYLFIDSSEKEFEKLKSKLEELSSYDVYKGFYDVLISEDISLTLSKFMNNNWYKLCECFPWHDSHKLTNNTYFGYMSFIGSAIAKRYKVDTSSVKYILDIK